MITKKQIKKLKEKYDLNWAENQAMYDLAKDLEIEKIKNLVHEEKEMILALTKKEMEKRRNAVITQLDLNNITSILEFLELIASYKQRVKLGKAFGLLPHEDLFLGDIWDSQSIAEKILEQSLATRQNIINEILLEQI